MSTYKYIAMPVELFKPEDLQQALGDNPYPNQDMRYNEEDHELMLYSLKTGNLSTNYQSVVFALAGCHLVESEEEMAGFILANRLGANLDGLFSASNNS